MGNADMGFHRIMLRAGKVKGIFKDCVGVFKSGGDIAALVAKMQTDVAVVVDDMRTAAAIARVSALELFMHQRRARLERVVDAEYRRQLFIIDVDKR